MESLRIPLWLGLAVVTGLSGCVTSPGSGYEPVYDYQYNRAYPDTNQPEYWPPYYGGVPRAVIIDGHGMHDEGHHVDGGPHMPPPPAKGPGWRSGDSPSPSDASHEPHFRRADERDERPGRDRPERFRPRPSRDEDSMATHPPPDSSR